MSTQRKHRRLDEVEDAQPAFQSEHTFVPELSDRSLAKRAWPDGPPNGPSWDELDPSEFDAEISRALNQQ